jgi:hypothetical protein
MTTEAGLPPGAERDEKGQLFRMVIRSTAGKKRDVRRPVALTLEEAKEKRWGDLGSRGLEAGGGQEPGFYPARRLLGGRSIQ